MLWQELRFAVRRLLSAPAFAIASVTAIALGTGATTAVISVVETVLLRPLPFAEPARLLVVTTRRPQGTITTASPSRFNVWRREATAFEALAAYRVHQVNVTEATDPEVVRAASQPPGLHGLSIEGRALDGLYHGGAAFVPVSGRYFEALRIPLRRGRLLRDADRAGSAGVVALHPNRDPVIGATAVALFDAAILGRRSHDVTVSMEGQELAKLSLDFSRLP